MENLSNQTENGFSLDVKPAHKLRLAIEALRHNDFNPEGFGRVDVNDKSFQITVWNLTSRVVGHLRFCANQSTNYTCSKPIKAKKIDLNSVFAGLNTAADQDTVTISCVDGSEDLFFAFGNDPVTRFSTKLLELDAHNIIQRLPVIHSTCDAILSTQSLRKIIPLMVQNGIRQRVTVKITDANVIITMGEIKWQTDVQKIDGMKQATPDEEYNGSFKWPHTESLRIASNLERLFALSFIDLNPNTFLLHFFTRENWHLVYIKIHCISAEPQPYSLYKAATSTSNQELAWKFPLPSASTLNDALQSLTDYSFYRPGGLARMEVNNKGIKITVHNSTTNVTGSLRLLASCLRLFKCNKPIENQMIDLHHLAQCIFYEPDNALLSFDQVDGSDEITIKSAYMNQIRPDHNIKMFRAKVYPFNDEFIELPIDIKFVCVLPVLSKFLREMIPLMVKNRQPQTVTLEIKDGYASFSIGQKSWNLQFNKELVGQVYKVCFMWPHPELLKWASSLSRWFRLYILTDPPNSIMLRFTLPDIGCLDYIRHVSFMSWRTVREVAWDCGDCRG